MILEIIAIEPLDYYDDPYKLRKDVRNFVFKKGGNEIYEEYELLLKDDIIKRKVVVEKNEYDKMIIINQVLWFSDEKRKDYYHIVEKFKKIFDSDNLFSISNIEIKKIPSIKLPSLIEFDNNVFLFDTESIIKKKSRKWSNESIEINI